MWSLLQCLVNLRAQDRVVALTTMDSANAAVASASRRGLYPAFKSRPPPVEEAAYCAAAAGLPVPNTMTFAPIGVRL